jgi:hypothetical protein
MRMEEITAVTRRLDMLPADIRSYFLTFLDLEGLSALVHASSVFHAQYQEARHHLLLEGLERTAADAFAIRLYQSNEEEFRSDVSVLLQPHFRIKARQRLSFDGKLDLTSVVDMAHYYFNVVKRFADSYAAWALDNLAKDLESTDVSASMHKLTGVERMRLTQAIYRYQLLCHILGRGQSFDYIPDQQAKAISYFDSMEPWETEELYMFFDFVRGRYAKLLDDVREDLHPDNTRFDDQGRPPTPTGAFDLSDEGKADKSP